MPWGILIDGGNRYSYSIQHPGNVAYVFVVEGDITLDDTTLGRRDAVGVYDTKDIHFQVNEKAKVLVIEVPME